MKHPLAALKTKLTWEMNELNGQLQTLQKELLTLTLDIHNLDQIINNSSFSSLVINPELEINRLNFITQEVDRKRELTSALKEYECLKLKVQDNLQRVKTELKKLEKHTIRTATVRERNIW